MDWKIVQLSVEVELSGLTRAQNSMLVDSFGGPLEDEVLHSLPVESHLLIPGTYLNWARYRNTAKRLGHGKSSRLQLLNAPHCLCEQGIPDRIRIKS